MKMESLLQTIGLAVQNAHRAIDYNAVGQFFDTYFDKRAKDADTVTYTPKMLEIEIPSPELRKAGKMLYAPTAALVQHKSMQLDCVKVQLHIDVAEEADGTMQVSTQGFHSQEDGSASKNAGTLEITLKCSDAAEGIARIETQLYGLL